MADNVVTFPKFNVREGLAPSPEEIQARVDSIKYVHIAEILGSILDTLENQLIIGGFEADDDAAKDWAMVVFSLESLMAKKYDIYHDFQTLAEKVFVDNPRDPDSWVITRNLSEIDFEKERNV